VRGIGEIAFPLLLILRVGVVFVGIECPLSVFEIGARFEHFDPVLLLLAEADEALFEELFGFLVLALESLVVALCLLQTQLQFGESRF